MVLKILLHLFRTLKVMSIKLFAVLLNYLMYGYSICGVIPSFYSGCWWCVCSLFIFIDVSRNINLTDGGAAFLNRLFTLLCFYFQFYWFLFFIIFFHLLTLCLFHCCFSWGRNLDYSFRTLHQSYLHCNTVNFLLSSTPSVSYTWTCCVFIFTQYYNIFMSFKTFSLLMI